ncbi:unnamed protein product [Xylocopa violacea]|uniref:WD repeat-containing protein 67 n=1 Tax=Xylocopa violacea TaxID=135666 RepID=A0ABP1NX45_XYLVO
MYKKTWQNLRKVDDNFELEPETSKKTQCFSRVNFTHVAFAWNEEYFVAIDTTGYLYFIDLLNNCPSYQKLGNVGKATFLAFSPINKFEVLVGLTTADIKILRVNANISQFCLLIAHKIPPVQISFYNKYCITFSRKEVIIWCLQSCSKAQQLKINTKNVVIKKASFSNLGHIVVLYYNDNMQIWNFNQLENDVKIDAKVFGIRSIKDFIFTQNGRAIIIISAQNKIIILNTCNWNLMKTLNLPENFNGIKCLSIVPSPLDGGANNIIACLSSNCNLYFFDLNQSCIIHTLQPVKPIKKIVVSPTGRYIVYIKKEGYLKLMTIETLFSEKCEAAKTLKEACRPIAHKTDDHLQCVRQNIKHELSLEKLILILKEFGEYPEKYRILIWSTILQLPANRNAYNALANKAASTHLSLDILKNYSLANRSKRMLLMTTVHCLIQWCPLLVQCSFLPNLIFPFLMIFQKDQLFGFEMVLTILLNYCQKWFEYHPLPPLNVLGIVENILLRADSTLLNVFCERGITSSEYAWPLLTTAMRENIKKYFTRQGHIKAKELLKIAQQLDNYVPLTIHPSHYIRNEIITLPPKGPYPPFMLDDFPKFLTDEVSVFELEKLKERNRMRHEQNSKLMEIAETNRLKHEAKVFMDQIHQTRLNEAQRCFKQQISDLNWKLAETEKQSETRKMRLGSIYDHFQDNLQLDLNICNEDTEDLEDDKTKRYEQLQQDVDKLEYEVQNLLDSLRSQK